NERTWFNPRGPRFVQISSTSVFAGMAKLCQDIVLTIIVRLPVKSILRFRCAHANLIDYAATTFVYVESLVPLNSGTYIELPEIEDPKGNSEDEGGSEEEEEEGEEEEYEIAEGFPASPKSVNEARETSPRKSCETLARYNHYVENYMDLKRRKLELETRKLDFKIRVQENRQENQHMGMDTSKMNALQLQWWQMRANQIAEKYRVFDMSIGDVNDDKEEDKNRNDVEQEEDVKNSKKKAKMT
ncbi:hypothetical protein MKW98_020896, partial [Papaver atlanticum]